MSDVKWIKITTDIFDDEKVLIIESMPDADSIIVIWFKLLILAGKQNNNGVFLMSNRIAYTDEMLAAIFRRKLSTVRLALNTFKDLGMIDIVENVVTIPNWNKHQNLDAYEKKKERDRLYQAERRANQRALVEKSSDSNAIESSYVVVSDKEEDKDIELEGEEECIEPPAATRISPKDVKHKYGEYGWVRLTDAQYAKLLHDLGLEELLRCIKYVDESAQANKNKNKWSDWNLVIRKCTREGWGRNSRGAGGVTFAQMREDGRR